MWSEPGAGRTTTRCFRQLAHGSWRRRIGPSRSARCRWQCASRSRTSCSPSRSHTSRHGWHSPRPASALMIAVVIPLWANYLIRVFAWKAILEGGGPADALFRVWACRRRSLSRHAHRVWMTFCYLWLPFAILPIYASLERVPPSSARGLARSRRARGHTFRRVVLPARHPGIVAGSIFTFSLDAGRLHRAGARRQGAVLRQRDRATNAVATVRWPRRSPCCRWRSCSSISRSRSARARSRPCRGGARRFAWFLRS